MRLVSVAVLLAGSIVLGPAFAEEKEKAKVADEADDQECAPDEGGGAMFEPQCHPEDMKDGKPAPADPTFIGLDVVVMDKNNDFCTRCECCKTVEEFDNR